MEDEKNLSNKQKLHHLNNKMNKTNTEKSTETTPFNKINTNAKGVSHQICYSGEEIKLSLEKKHVKCCQKKA